MSKKPNYMDLEQRLRDIEKEFAVYKKGDDCLHKNLYDAGITWNIISIDHKILDISKDIQDIFGDIKGKLCYQAFRGLSQPCEPCPLSLAIKSNSPKIDEMNGLDGKSYRITVLPIADEDGVIRSGREIITDISDLKDKEQALRESEEKYRLLFNNANDAIFVHQPSKKGKPGKFIEVNDVACKRYGLSRDELLQLTPLDLSLPGQSGQALENLKKTMSEGHNVFEITHKTKDNLKILVEVSNHVFDLFGQATVLSIVRDISERKKAKTDLEKSEQFLKNVFDAIQDGISVLDPELSILRVNSWMRKMYERGKPIVGRKCYEVYQQRKAVCPWCPSIKAFETGEKHKSVVPYPSENNPKGWIELSAFPMKDNRGEVVSVIEYVKDISEQKIAEEALIKSETHLSNALLMAKMGHWEYDLSKDEFTFSDEFYTMLGTSAKEVGGYTMSPEEYSRRFVHPDDTWRVKDEIDRLLKEKEKDYSRTIEHRILCLDGSVGYISVRFRSISDKHGNIIKTIGASQDITERKIAENEMRRIEEERIKTETRLLQAEKIESLGTLTGGIAHDFNNELQIIMMNAELLQMSDQNNSNLDGILKASIRGKDLIKNLLLFARQAETYKITLDINEELKKAQDLLSTMPKIIEKSFDLEKNLWPIYADPMQIRRIFINLSTNARDAMPDGGTITYRTRNVTVDDVLRAGYPELDKARYVLLSVSDDGFGIPEEIRQKIFEPYFTTKPKWEGTGIGLATVHGIVEGHDGNIYVESTPGKGTTFTIYFPAKISSTLEKQVEKPFDIPIRKGNEKILLVDDEEQILKVEKQILEKLGYSVDVALNGEEGLRLYDPEKHALVIADKDMPKGDGYWLLKKIKEKSPESKVIIATGYASDEYSREAMNAGAKAFVEKPLKLKDFAEKVRTILDS